MIKVTEIYIEKPYVLRCVFNNKEVRLLNALPIIENQKHLKGVDQLFDELVFANVVVGELGEITWRNIVTTEYNGNSTCWDYDISPEFAYSNSINIDDKNIA